MNNAHHDLQPPTTVVKDRGKPNDMYLPTYLQYTLTLQAAAQ
jgi:hypothetical protein